MLFLKDKTTPDDKEDNTTSHSRTQTALNSIKEQEPVHIGSFVYFLSLLCRNAKNVMHAKLLKNGEDKIDK